jgi:uncharacterized membrane protein|uniref:Uncharacterized protein n=1 Tax=candidate division WOR-3 bacterium TaxID=2052148 RepID=A0A7V3VTN8_UNCW3
MVEVLVVILILSFLTLIFSITQKLLPVNIFQTILIILVIYLLVRVRVKISRAEKEKLRARIEELEKKIESLSQGKV